MKAAASPEMPPPMIAMRVMNVIRSLRSSARTTAGAKAQIILNIYAALKRRSSTVLHVTL